MRRGRPAAGVAAAIATLGSLAASGHATGAVSCAFSGSGGAPPGVVGVGLGAPGDSATLGVSGGNVVVNGATCGSAPLLGETAGTKNTEAIGVSDASGGPVELRIADPTAFAPGLTNEGDGSAEIELTVDLGPGPADVLRLEAGATDAEDRFELGAYAQVSAANFNPRTEGGRAMDPDLGFAGVDRVVADGRALDDVLDGSGGQPFGGPLPVELELFGFDGEDTLSGGAARDLLHGGPGDDLLAGGEERDVLLGDGEEDVLAGGAGPDRLDGGDDDDVGDYRVLPADVDQGIVASLGRGVVRGAGGGDRLVSIEGALGSPFGDRITGDAGLNFIEGGGGGDVLDGAAESDALLGASGADELIGGGARDVLIGGPGDDAIAGEIGKDIVVGGAGRDRVRTGEGVDVVDVSGGGRDIVDCGPGRDGYDADPEDRLRSCEIELSVEL